MRSHCCAQQSLNQKLPSKLTSEVLSITETQGYCIFFFLIMRGISQGHSQDQSTPGCTILSYLLPHIQHSAHGHSSLSPARGQAETVLGTPVPHVPWLLIETTLVNASSWQISLFPHPSPENPCLYRRVHIDTQPQHNQWPSGAKETSSHLAQWPLGYWT